ncbi:uncharacterized protein BJ212DRAFT_879798 [Suillus subaureus]|uniref:DNA helicase n=1 Tax=Suillus subaureus TaxID=48587 RepID=A0A9P7J6N4_9AGAM|nr:uncharacterized protein BJ212DRAFT_879798 [Suillus subaureus]KAG1805217.1 hypothetical protein BJ212DRAFT_879798 [Suillus subaureus]
MVDTWFAAFVDRIGEECSGDRQNVGTIAATTTGFNDTIDFLFLRHVLEDAETCLHRASLPPLNVYVDESNDKVLDRLPGNFQSYRQPERSRSYSIERTRTYARLPCDVDMPPHRLDLKQSCIYTIQQNLLVQNGLMRNARVRVAALHCRFVEVQLINTFESRNTPPPQLCVPSKLFVPDIESKTASFATHMRRRLMHEPYSTFEQRAICSRSIVHDVVEGENAETRCVYLQRRKRGKAANVVFPELLL